MKKFLYTMMAALFVAAGATAADYGGKKFYVNPGHGGHDSNDRPTPMPLNVEIFYESDGNLGRGLALRDFLTANNASVKMSRTTNTSADDLGLSTIAANSNSYGGYFMSLHTNAANASANYIIAFYRGTTTGAEAISGSKAMADKVAATHGAVSLSNFTYSTPRAVSDYSFNGWNYGVLRTNSRPGYLVETIFHDYRPEGLRMKSDTYLKYQAWQIARATLDKPGGTGTLPGCIIGDIRDVNKACGYTNYTTRGRDAYLAINSATVNLYNSSGTKVQTMTTDKCCNGVYAFFGLDAGTYSVEVVKSGYATQKKSVTVTANNATKQVFSLVEGTATGITTSKESLDFGSVTIGNSKSLTFTVTGTGLSSDITVTSSNAQITVSPASVSASASAVKVTAKYTPTAAGSISGKITLKSGSSTATVTTSGSAVNPPLTFTEGWNYSETSGKSPSWLPSGGWSTLRNMCFGDGKLYIVNPSGTEIYVVKCQTAELLTTLDMTGVDEGTFKVMDVKYVDGKVVACNLAAKTTEPIKVYVWDNDYAKPTCILTSTSRGDLTRMGDTFSIDGNLTSGRLLFCGGGTSETNKVVAYTITNGTASATPTTLETKIDDSTGLVMGLSPRALPETNSRYWVMGQNYAPTLIETDGLTISSLNRDAIGGEVAGNDFETFTYKGTSYALATTYLPKASQASGLSLTQGKVVLIDGTDGWNAATALGEYPSAGMGETRNTSFSTSCPVAVNGDSGVEFWVLISSQGIAYYKTGTVPTYTYTTAPTPTISVSSSTLKFGDVTLGNNGTKKVTVTVSNLEADATLSLSGTNKSMFKLSTSTIGKDATSASVTVTYTPTEEGDHTATLSIASTGATTAKVKLTGTGKPQVTFVDTIDQLEEMWVYSTQKGNTASAPWLSTTFTDNFSRDLAEIDGKLYVLNCKASGAPTVTVVNAYTGAQISTLDVSGIATTSTRVPLAGLTTLDSKLIGVNSAASNHTLKFYRWDSDASAPVLWAEDSSHGSTTIGDQISASGTMSSGALWLSNGAIVLKYTVTNSTVNTTPTTITLAKAIGTVNGSCGIIPESDGTFWAVGKDSMPIHFNADGSVIETLAEAAFGDTAHKSYKQGTSAVTFTLGNHNYMAGMTYVGTSTTIDYGSIALTDLASGATSATCIGNYPADGFGSTRNTQFQTAITYSLTENGHTVNIWGLTPGQGIAYYRYVGDKATGIEQVAVDQQLAMKVNVSGGHITLKGIEAQRVMIFNLAGSMVVDARGNEIDTWGLSGVHIIMAVDQTGHTHTAKVVMR